MPIDNKALVAAATAIAIPGLGLLLPVLSLARSPEPARAARRGPSSAHLLAQVFPSIAPRNTSEASKRAELFWVHEPKTRRTRPNSSASSRNAAPAMCCVDGRCDVRP